MATQTTSWANSGATFQATTPTQIGTFTSQTVDSDGDGIMDIDDNCPNTPGISYAQASRMGISVDQCGCPSDECDGDRDRDGVGNCDDACPNTLPGIRVTANGCVAATRERQMVELDVKFDFARANLKSQYQPDLDAVATLMQRYPRLVIVLEGHTDSDGSIGYNTGLATARAFVVRRELMARGVTPDRVFAVGYGEAFPVATNSTAVGRALNRRTVANFFF